MMLPNECEKMSDELWVMSYEWWVMEIEWQKLSDEKSLPKQALNHYKVVTTMLIHTWNKHLDIQANKNNASHLYAQQLTNA